MCSVPKPAALPSVPAAPPPPDKTATEFYLAQEEAEKASAYKKKRGTQKLQIQDKSPLVILDPVSGLNIP